MRDCVIQVYSEDSQLLSESPLRLAETPGQAALDLVYRDHLKKHKSAWAVVREGPVPRAVFIPEAALPARTKRLTGKSKSKGRWITTRVELGDPSQRAYLGPEVFFRLVDMGPKHAWLTRALLGMAQDVPSRAFAVGRAPLWGWKSRSEHWFLTIDRGVARLWGAGNTDERALDAIAAELRGSSVRDFLWAVGAVSFG